MIQGNKYSIGDTVYLLTEAEQLAYMVVQVRQNQGNTFSYCIVRGTFEYVAIEMELTSEKDIIKQLTS